MAELTYRSGLKSGVVAFKAVNSITRPGNTTAYTVGDLINDTSATTLLQFDFGTENANAVIEINTTTLISDNGSATTKLDAAVWFFNTSTILSGGAVSQVTDNSPFIPSMAQVSSKIEGVAESLGTTGSIGTTCYSISNSEKQVICKLDSNGKIWVALTANNAYPPANGEVLRLTLKGYILG